MNDLHEWYGERLYEKPEDFTTKSMRLIWNLKHLKGALNPAESIERFMSYEKFEGRLNGYLDA